MRWTPITMEAYKFAWRAHGEQRRKYTGAPYVEHCLAVAALLQAHGLPDEVVVAGILHDVIEDTHADYEAVRLTFGLEIADLVDMVTDVSKPCDGNRAARKALDREHLAEASPEGQSIKLADLIDNTSSIVEHDPGFARVYLAEKDELLKVLHRGHDGLRARAYGMLRIAKFELAATGTPA